MVACTPQAILCRNCGYSKQQGVLQQGTRHMGWLAQVIVQQGTQHWREAEHNYPQHGAAKQDKAQDKANTLMTQKPTPDFIITQHIMAYQFTSEQSRVCQPPQRFPAGGTRSTNISPWSPALNVEIGKENGKL